ncbi:MAG: Rpn family recombination-promoting nuclease/putative transposase, partial [Ruminiclostridium sp.]|nr:Rpn family recombination-promoting nuclease/putative transposase [Ruminiclostridium sp.]
MDDRERLREEIKKRIKQMCLMDDDFMTMVLQHKECAELVLRIILNRNDLNVLSCKSQYEIHSLSGRSVRLDVYAIDAAGKKYDIEIQRADSGAEPERARYNSSLLDANSLDKQKLPKDLPEIYVIFITENDVLKRNLPIYNIERVITQTGELFNDRSHIIYVNSQIRNETALGKLMSDFHNKDPKGMNYPVLEEKSEFYKYGGGQSNMCRLVEELVAEEGKKIQEKVKEACREEGREEGREETTINF